MSADQGDIDNILASFDEALGNDEQSDLDQNQQIDSQPSSEEENTASSPEGQGEADKVPEPWVDYIPKFEYKESDDLIERINQHFDVVEETMLEKELKFYNYVDQVGGVRYYDDFLGQVNDSFRTLVKMKQRRVAGKKAVTKARDLSKCYFPGVYEPENIVEENSEKNSSEQTEAALTDEPIENVSVTEADEDTSEQLQHEETQDIADPENSESADEMSQDDVDSLLEPS